MECSHHPRSGLCVSDFIHEIKTSFLLLTVLISLVSTYLQSNVTPAEKWVWLLSDISDKKTEGREGLREWQTHRDSAWHRFMPQLCLRLALWNTEPWYFLQNGCNTSQPRPFPSPRRTRRCLKGQLVQWPWMSTEHIPSIFRVLPQKRICVPLSTWCSTVTWLRTMNGYHTLKN